MMKYQIRILSIWLSLFVYNIIALIWLNFPDGSIQCLAHCLLSCVLGSVVFSLIFKKKSWLGEGISLADLCIVTFLIYFSISSIKYLVEPEYPEFVSDNWYRFLGSLIVFFAILFSSFLLFLRHKRKYQVHHKINEDIVFKNNIFGTLTFMTIVCAFKIYVSIRIGSVYTIGRTWSTPIEAFLYLALDLLACFAIGMSINKLNKKSLLSFFPLIMYVITMLICSFLSGGSRTDLVKSIIVVIYCMIIFKKIKIETFCTVFAITPFAIFLLTLVIFTVSGRLVSADFTSVVKNLGYRFDLGDFPITCLERTGYFKTDFSQFVGGLFMSIPSFLLPDGYKADNVNAYTNMVVSNGLLTWKDYPDTYFSMGENLGGIIGLFIIPLLFIWMWDIFDGLASKSRNGSLIKVSIVGAVVTIERAWTEMLPLLRNVLLCVLLAIVLSLFLRRVTKKTNCPKELNYYEVNNEQGT